MVEIVTIYGRCHEGKTTRLISNYTTDDCILISNEMTVDGIHSFGTRLNVDLRGCFTIATHVDERIKNVIEEIDRDYSNVDSIRTLLLDGIDMKRQVDDIMTFIPGRFDKIVYTEQLSIDGSINLMKGVKC